jgi:pimeloyl-ACP methyl ester carboxylesterase
MGWYWEKRGDNEFTPPQITTIFQGWEEPKAGLFSGSEVPVQTEVFVREIIQNFIDASREEFSPDVTPKLTFRFLELKGADAKRVADELGLKDIPGHYAQLSDQSKSQLRIPDSSVLQGQLSSIRLLVATEFGTSGMFGQWERSSTVKDAQGREIRNKMRDAMLASVRDASAGKGLGSFGEGKKAVIAVSAPRTIFAYTCFDPDTSADGVYSRFLGALYWENHNLDNTKYAGLALLGKDVGAEARPVPFSDHEADDLVRAINIPGLAPRIQGGNLDTGTTLVFLDPVATASQVAESIARNWWPLIIDGEAEFEVLDEAGHAVPIEIPDELEPFVEAYSQQDKVEVTNWENADGPAYLCETLTTPKLGPSARLSLAIDLRPGVGFSRSNPEKNWSLVALIRNGMIVKYQHVPRSQSDHAPFVRGVLEVNSREHSESEATLRKIEPPLHNNWPIEKEGVDSETVKHSREISNRLRKTVEEFKKRYSTNIPDSDQDLPIFRELLGVAEGSTVIDPGPIQPLFKSPVSLLNNSVDLVDGSKSGTRVVNSSRKIALRKGLDFDELGVVIEIGWEVDEGGVWTDVTDKMLGPIINSPANFDASNSSRNVFVGSLTTSEVVFEWTTNDFSELWTLRPFMKVTQTGDSE